MFKDLRLCCFSNLYAHIDNHIEHSFSKLTLKTPFTTSVNKKKRSKKKKSAEEAIKKNN